jgi:tetratricopeptide (TPR) repeat protein
MGLLDETPEPQKKLPETIVQQNWVLWSLGDMPKMRKGIDMGLSLKPNADLLLQDGIWKLRAGQFAAARVSLEKALNINPGDIRAMGALSDSYRAQKQNVTALQKVKEYASKQPKSAAVQAFLGVMLVANGNRQDARVAFTAAKAADPKFVNADLYLAQTDIADGRPNDAEQRLQTLLASDPMNTNAKLWLANLNITKGDLNAALAHLSAVVNAEPNNSQALNNYAYLLTEFKNDPATALAYAQRAKELSPTDGTYGDTLGWILYRKGLYPMAITELERVANNGANPVWKYHLAMAYAKAGNTKRAQEVLQTALKLNPNLPEAKIARELLNPVKQ